MTDPKPTMENECIFCLGGGSTIEVWPHSNPYDYSDYEEVRVESAQALCPMKRNDG